MSSSYSANQYDSAFKPNKLQNWTLPTQFKERPSAVEGHTTFIATDRGHLLPGRKRGSAWTSFQGTWDLPSRIPPVHINPTGRSLEGQRRLQTWGQSQRLVHSATDKPHEAGRATRTPQDKFQDTDHPDQLNEEPQLLGESPVQPGEEKPEQAQSRPATQQSQAPSRPASQQSRAESRAPSQANQPPSRPASQTSRSANEQVDDLRE